MRDASAGIRPEDLYTLPIVGGVCIDPAGRRAAYVVTTMDPERDAYDGSIRVVSLDDGKVRTYTRGSSRDVMPRWSPDGTRLAFVSDRSERRQIWFIDVDGGEPYPGPAVHGDVNAIAFSPDGRRIAAIATPDARRREAQLRGWRRIDRIRYRADGAGYLDDAPRLWVVDAFTGEGRPIGDGTGWVAAPAWSPDGSKLVFAAEHRIEADSLWHTELWVADVVSGALRKILTFEGAIEAPAWYRDGTRVAFVGFEEKEGYALSPLRLYALELRDGARPVRLTDDDAFVCGNHVLNDLEATPAVSAPIALDDDALLVLASERGSAGVYRVSAGGARRLTPDDVSVSEFGASGGVIAACAAGTAQPPEVYATTVDGDRWRKVTSEAGSWASTKDLRRAERFQVRGDSADIDYWILRTNAGGDRPAVLQIHGGPHFAYGESFFFEFQLLAAHGMHVVFCNPRGSQTYGRRFAEGLRGDWAAPAFDDCMAAIDAAIARGGIDAARVGVAGGSYGGYLTAWTVSHTDRFRSAVAMRSATNLASLWGTSEVGRMLESELGARPLDDPEIYRRCSPLTYADRIETPLLLLHAENDYRCPIEQSEQLFTALRQRGARVELVRFANADHGLSRAGPPRLRCARLEAILAWFLDGLALGRSHERPAAAARN